MSPMLTQSQRDSLEQATQMYQHEVGLAAAYLAGRGLSEETVRTYRLGVVTPTNAQLGDEQYVGRLAIPFMAGDEMQLKHYSKGMASQQTPSKLFSKELPGIERVVV